jgi:hypothetical protein
LFVLGADELLLVSDEVKFPLAVTVRDGDDDFEFEVKLASTDRDIDAPAPARPDRGRVITTE